MNTAKIQAWIEENAAAYYDAQRNCVDFMALAESAIIANDVMPEYENDVYRMAIESAEPAVEKIHREIDEGVEKGYFYAMYPNFDNEEWDDEDRNFEWEYAQEVRAERIASSGTE